MKRPRQSYIWILAAASVGLLALVAIRRAQIVRMPSARLAVAATIYPLYDIVRNLASEETAVRLIVTIGHGLDDWAAQAARAS